MNDLQPIQLTNKVAVVTGGGRGIGRVIAQQLAAVGAGVMVVSRSGDELDETVRLIQNSGGRAVAFRADVTDTSMVGRMIAETQRQIGEPDILVNNAGAFGPIGPLWEADIEAWWGAMEANLKGTFLPTRMVLPGMIQRRRGCIINVSSSVALRPTAYAMAYATSKAALVHFTACLALETAEHGVVTFAIHPGTVRTEMTRGIIETEVGQTWMPRTLKTFEDGRDVPPERAAEMVLYLASGAADVLSGRFLLVTDDLPELVRQAQ